MPTPNVLLRHERQLRGWSQAHLAEQIDVPDYYISRWERGEVLPSPYYQQKLCEVFADNKDCRRVGHATDPPSYTASGSTNSRTIAFPSASGISDPPRTDTETASIETKG